MRVFSRATGRWGPFLAIAACLLAGCSSYDEDIAVARRAFHAADYAVADATLARLLTESGQDPSRGRTAPRDSDAVLLLLERAMVRLAQGRPAAAHALLIDAVDRLDYLQQRSAAEEIASWAADDTARGYSGDPHEIVLARCLLVLTGMLLDDPETLAWSNEAVAAQESALVRLGEVMETLRTDLDASERAEALRELRGARVPLAPFLAAVAAEDIKRSGGEARRGFTTARAWWGADPHGDALAPHVERAGKGLYTADPAHGVVWVFGLVGRGPFKVTESLDAANAAVNIARLIWAIAGRTGFFVPDGRIPVPALRHPENAVDGLQVGVGSETQDAAGLAEVGRIAAAAFASAKDGIHARALVRRLVKIVVEEVGKGVSKSKWADVGISILGAIWRRSEVADTRMWSFLPASFHGARLELPPGVHELHVQPTWGGRPAGGTRTIRVQVTRGQATYVVAHVAWRGTPVMLMTNRPAVP